MEKKKLRAEEALRNNEQRYRELYDSVQRQAQEMALLDRVRTAVAGELDLKGVIRTVVEGIAETFGYPLVSLYMRQGDCLFLEHQVGYAEVIDEIPITKGVLGKTVRSGQAILLDDVHRDPDFLEAILGIATEVCVPLFDREQVVGALNVESPPEMKLTEADLRLMAALGENISIAIGRARLYTEIRESEERYRSLFQNASMGIFHSLPEGRFIQVNPALAKMFGYASPEEIVREHGFSELAGCEKLKSLRLPVARTPHLREIVDTARPVIVPDTVAVPEWRKEECAVWARSYAGIPIQYMGMVVGFINLYSATAGFFTQAHTERMQTFANQIATVFANSRLVESLQKANERLNAQLSEIQALEAELREQAIRDPLTRLFNRRYLQVTLVREIARVNRTSQPVGIMIMDIDRFKLINDAYGHEAGDHFLHALGELRKNNTRREDIACRYGGEEFVVVMPGAALQIAQERAEILRSRIEALRVPHENWNIHATVSLGVAAYPQHGVTSEDVLIRADRALYHAKQEGRNRVVVYTDTIQMTFS